MLSTMMTAVAVLAQEAAPGSQPGMGMGLLQLLPIALIFVIFYFLLIMPARKRQKALEAMIKALQPGDKIVTTGGIIGTITRAEDKTLDVRIAPSVEVKVLRSHVAGKAEETPK